MDKQDQIDYTKAYVKAVMAEAFRLALQELLKDPDKLKELGLEKQPSLKD